MPCDRYDFASVTATGEAGRYDRYDRNDRYDRTGTGTGTGAGTGMIVTIVMTYRQLRPLLNLLC